MNTVCNVGSRRARFVPNTLEYAWFRIADKAMPTAAALKRVNDKRTATKKRSGPHTAESS